MAISTVPAAPAPAAQSSKRLAPGPNNKSLFGSVSNMRRNGILQFYYDTWKEYGDLIRYQIGPMTMHVLVQPEHIQYVLVKNTENFRKGRSHAKIRLALGSGLLTSEGPFWQRQRRLMSPTYTPKGVTRFATIMTDAAQQMLVRWQEAQRDGSSLKVNAEMMRLTMTIISRSMFGVDISEGYAEVSQALRFILEFASTRSLSFIDPPLWIPTPRNRRMNGALQTIDEFLYGVIAERRNNPDSDYLLTLLMQARDEETGEYMSEKQLRDEALITFFAGHETTAQLMTWIWYTLARRPDIEEKLHSELAAVLGGRTPTVEDVPNLVYTRRVIDETLRLYPPVAVTARDVEKEDEIGGYEIPAGSMTVLAPYLTHRHPDFWAHPETFDPDHFLPDQIAARPRYAYYPFGAGQRICLGMHFALLEAVLVLAEAAQRFNLRLTSGQDIHPVMVGVMRPSSDLWMTVEPR